MWGMILGIGKFLLGFLPGMANAQAQVLAEKQRADGTIATGLSGVATAEATGRAAERQAYASAGYWWAVLLILIPPFGAASAMVFHLWAVVLDSVFLFGWGVAALPGKMADWQGVVITTIVGGGGIAALMVFMGKR